MHSSFFIAWGHLISWYKQMYDVLLSTGIAGNYYSKFNKLTIYFFSKSVVVCDFELEIFLPFYNSRIIRITVHVSRMVDVYRLDLSVPRFVVYTLYRTKAGNTLECVCVRVRVCVGVRKLPVFFYYSETH